MATAADPAPAASDDSAFFARYVLILALLIVFGFAQFALRGFSAFALTVPWLHVHGIVMLAWLGLFVMQTRHVTAGNIDRHRKLGWIGAFLAVAVVGTASFSGIMALRAGYVPPFFTPAYFLALTQVGAVVFGGLVFAAITRRSQTDYHRRLMLGSLIGITEPAFGRLLPMPLMIGWGEWVVLAIQLGMVAVIALHDRRTLGRIHPATATVGAILAMMHVLVELSGVSPWVQGLAASIAAG